MHPSFSKVNVPCFLLSEQMWMCTCMPCCHLSVCPQYEEGEYVGSRAVAVTTKLFDKDHNFLLDSLSFVPSSDTDSGSRTGPMGQENVSKIEARHTLYLSMHIMY